MGLLTIIKKLKQREKEFRVLILGLDNAGKTTMVKQYMGEDINTISPTLGFNIETIKYEQYTLNFWDIGGQKSLRSYWKNYFEQTDGLIWVVDSADIRRLEDCREELNKLLIEERLAGASLLIIANKQDVAGALSSEEVAKVLDVKRISESRHCHILAASAVTGDGLAEGIEWIVSDIADRLYMLE